MKRIYFVRHGSTAGNESEAYQLATTPLSEKGRQQGEFLAERFTKIPFDAIIASDMERAHETARIIGSKTGHTALTTELFREVRRPSEVWGKPRNDPKVTEIMDKTYKNFYEGGTGHISDEENFYDVKERAIASLQYLTGRPEETLVVVTHGVILRMIFCVMLMGEDLSPNMFERVYGFMFPSNTGVSWCEYDNEFHPGTWQLITWNDHAHLG